MFDDVPAEASTEQDTPPRLQLKQPKYTCDFCKYTTDKKCNLTKHLKCVHYKEKFLCEICNNRFSNLPQHMRVTHLTTQGKLHSQKKRDNSLQSFQNSESGESGRVGSQNISSASRTIDIPDYICKLCSLQFRTRLELTSHKKSHRDKNKKKECEICKKDYSNLEQHIKIVHKKIKNFECVNCKKRFYDNRELRNHHLKSLQTGQCHTSVCTEDKKFSCKVDKCEYKAKTKNNLALHIESVHLGNNIRRTFVDA